MTASAEPRGTAVLTAEKNFKKDIAENPRCTFSSSDLMSFSKEIINQMDLEISNIQSLKSRLEDFGDDGSNGFEELYCNCKAAVDPDLIVRLDQCNKKFIKLMQVRKAVESGIFSNRCKLCGQPIGLARMMLLPTTRVCSGCS